jgi:hypothetical protein
MVPLWEWIRQFLFQSANFTALDISPSASANHDYPVSAQLWKNYLYRINFYTN